MVAHGRSFSCKSLGNQQQLLRKWPWRMRAILHIWSPLSSQLMQPHEQTQLYRWRGVTQQSPAHSQNGEDEGIVGVSSPYVLGGRLCGNRKLKLPVPHPWLLPSLRASPAQVCSHSCHHSLPP